MEGYQGRHKDEDTQKVCLLCTKNSTGVKHTHNMGNHYKCNDDGTNKMKNSTNNMNAHSRQKNNIIMNAFATMIKENKAMKKTKSVIGATVTP